MARSSHIPDWPRMMKPATAAAYCDATMVEFQREVASGRLPMPVKLCAGERWSRQALDEALERLAGDRLPEWRKDAKLYAEG